MTSLTRQQREGHYLATARAWVNDTPSLEQVQAWARKELHRNPGKMVTIAANTSLVDIYRQFSRGQLVISRPLSALIPLLFT